MRNAWHRRGIVCRGGGSLPRLAVILEAGGEVGVQEQQGRVRAQGLARARVVGEPQEAADDVLEQAHAGRRLQRLHQAHQALLHREEALRRVAHIVEAHLHARAQRSEAIPYVHTALSFSAEYLESKDALRGHCTCTSSL